MTDTTTQQPLPTVQPADDGNEVRCPQCGCRFALHQPELLHCDFCDATVDARAAMRGPILAKFVVADAPRSQLTGNVTLCPIHAREYMAWLTTGARSTPYPGQLDGTK